MADEDKNGGSGAWSRVPTWDGNPQGWRAFMREMQWWMSALDLEGTKKYNLAARWLLRQSGIVRQRGEEFSPADLEYQREITATDPVTGEVVVITPEDPLAGLHKLLRALEGINGKTVLDKRGDLRNAFYLELRRRPGERLAEFCTRFRSAVADLKAEGVVLPSSELGWFLKQKLGLDAIRVQLLETALQGKESYEETELEVLRLFRDLHAADPLVRKGPPSDGHRNPILNKFMSQQHHQQYRNPSSKSSYAPSTAPSGSSFGSSRMSTSYRSDRPFPRKPQQRQAFAAEVEEEEPHEETHEDEPDEQYSLEEVLQAEAEILATELEEAVDDGIGPDIIQDVEETVESAAEALLTMREARSKLAEVRKDRGYGKASTGKMANKKSKLPCFDCNQLGHWAGDPECKNPGAGLGRKSPKKHPKSVKVVETMNTEHVVADPALLPAVDGNEALAVSCVSRNLKLSDVFHAPNSKEVHAVHTGLTADKRLVGALDSACNRTVTGSEWLHSFLRCLEHAPQAVRDLVQSSPEHEVFRFGDGGTQVSSTRWRIPVMLGDTVLCVWVSEVPVPSLGLLLGRDFLESVGANMSFANRVIQFEYLKCHALPLKQLAAGHYMLRLLPSHWAGLGTQKWRRLGIDGVVELQMSMQEWLKVKLVDKKHASLQDKLGTYGGKTQEENGIVPKGTFQKAELWQAWTVSNMSDCIWLRNRMGIRYAFLEDPILMGMLAAKSAKGLTARVKKESIAEAVEKAHQSQMQGTADQEARAMIGPRGGLPTLRSDLLRLAALLHVHIGEKDTVPVIKEKLKPMVEALKGRTPAADSRASSSTAQPPPVRLTSAPVQKPAAKPPPRAIQSFTPQPCEVLHQTRSMAALEQLLKQVSAAVEQIKDQPYSMQTQGTMPQQHSLEQASDVSMNDLDAEAQRQLMEDAALSMEAVYEEKLEAQYGEWGMLELTPEQKERAWEKHRRDQLSRFGVETAKINQALQTEFENEMNSFVNDEVFVHAIDFTTCLKPSSSVSQSTSSLRASTSQSSSSAPPFVSEVYTNTQRVMREAARRGHRVGTPMSLETGWNFLDADHREAAKRLVRKEKPYFLMIAFPCGPFGPLLRLNSSVNLEEILEKGRILMRFALELAAIQHEAGRHYILENPQPSAAWKEPDMVKFLDEFEAKVANLHQCQFGLRSLRGGLHRKATRVASSSFPVVALLDGRVCDRSHGHDPVIGGRVVTERAGHYPGPLARAFVVGMERQFNSEVEDGTKTPNAKIPASVRAAIARLHDNTGHRSNRRLARALAISGAPAAAIQAAKEHKCSICAERAPPKSQRVGSLPQPRDVSDQVHIDLLEAEDCKGTKYYIIHATDFCTRFQMSELLERKTAGAVVNFLKTRWWPIFGPMRTLVADQGREFILWELQDFCSRHSVRAEMARSRNSTIADVPEPGSIVYFFRFQKYNNKNTGSKRRLALRKWHGPGLLVAVEQGSEGNTGANAYISFKGQLTKCSLEHVRRASPMEQIVAGDWEEAIREAVASALHDMTRSGLPARPQEVHDQPIPEESEWPPVPISESESPSTESPDGEPLPAHPAFPTVGETPPVKPRERQPSSDLPPVHPREMVNALQSGTEASVSRLPSHSGVMASRLTTPMTRQNTPMAAPPLFAGASSSSAGVLGAQIERARLLEKRPAEMETEELRSLASSQAAFERPVGQPGCEPELHDTLVVSKEDVMSVLEQGDKVHPLIKLYCEACVDRANPLDAQVHDHGTWDGRWGLPSRSEFLARKKLGLMWPCGADELHEANAVQAARKEYYWRAMTPDQKAALRVAAEAGWSVWETNEAVEVLDDKTSQRIRADLKAKKEDCKILTPRCSLALGAPPPRAIHHHELLARSATQHARSAPGLRRSDLGHGAELLCGGKPVAPSCRDSMEQLRWNFAATNFQVAISACDAAGAADLARQLLRRWPCWSLEGFNSAVSAQRGIYWQQALELLDRAEELQLQLDLITYSAAISACQRHWHCGLELLGRLQREGLTANAVVWTTCLRACVLGEQWQAALDLFEQMQSQKQLTLLAFCDLFSALAERSSVLAATRIGDLGRQQQWPRALELFRETCQEDWSNTISCNAVINALAKSSQWQRALSFLQRTLQPDVVSYSTVMSAMERASEWLIAFQCLSEMERQEVQPNTISYNAALSACEKSQEWSWALLLMVSMGTVGIQADVVTVSATLSALEKGSRWRGAHRLLGAMPLQALQPDVICQNAAIRSSTGHLVWSSACDLLRALTRASLQPSRNSFNAVISACASGDEWQLSLCLLEEMRTSVVADAVSFSAAMAALEAQSLWHVALALLAAARSGHGGRMRGRTREELKTLDAVCFNSAVQVCAAARRWAEALELFGDLSQLFGPTKLALDACLDACLEVWPQAFHLLATATSSSTSSCDPHSHVSRHLRLELQPQDEVSYGLLFNALETSGAWEAAIQALHDLTREQVRPNAIMFGRCMSCGGHLTPKHWLNEMIRQGVELHCFAYTACIKSASTWAEAILLYEDLLERDLKPDLVIFSSLVEACERAGGPGAPGRQSPREPHWDPGWAAQLEEQMVCDLAELSLTERSRSRW
ncbi:unnamed protein product [Durusdinium trenchii]|uniref:Integrase catalytic domain-containing protein n=1 Tax=Durusdinium trenchii TaxID=1381693 RepID=A0ABP0MLV5_9DINO